MNFSTSPEFDRDLKSLIKKWRSLADDFIPVKKTLPLLYSVQADETEADFRARRAQFFNNKRATILQTTDNGNEVVKMRLDCVSLGNKNVLRLIFVYIKKGDEVVFVELFTKNDKNREDSRRFSRYVIHDAE